MSGKVQARGTGGGGEDGQGGGGGKVGVAQGSAVDVSMSWQGKMG